MKEEKSGLDEAVSVASTSAQAVKGMIKTGKAVSAVAKGAAAGGPYGAGAHHDGAWMGSNGDTMETWSHIGPCGAI